ncbi:MAG: 2-phosphosulfolactate phosphatase [Kiritimatiellae bacterium]|nr:2-phosphosulfolactate phosphatase [Kiritimatiellia bacterium]
MTFDQREYDIRCEWGEQGVARLAPISDAVIIVDVMSFSTCVTIAAARGATVFPYRWRDDSRIAFARSVGAELAGPRGKSRFSLSPASLLQVPPGTRLVLPSPNGSTLTLSAGPTPTLAGCFRNAQAVARAAMGFGTRIAVIPAGERWKEDQTLRPCFEDLAGAGAIIRHLAGSMSPEAQVATDAFRGVASDLLARLRQCSSGKELIEMGFEEDIAIIAQMDVDDCAPIVRDGAYGKAEHSAL